MEIVLVNSTRINKVWRAIKSVFGRDTHESIQISQYGDDSVPLKGTKAIKSETTTAAIHVVLGYFNRNCKALEGEKRLFSSKSDGSESFYIWLKNDGTFEIGGNSDCVAGYNELKTAFNSLQSDFNAFKATHTHLGVTSGAGTSGIPTDTAANAADITKCAKINIKTY
jgi:hypothetical protein